VFITRYEPYRKIDLDERSRLMYHHHYRRLNFLTTEPIVQYFDHRVETTKATEKHNIE